MYIHDCIILFLSSPIHIISCWRWYYFLNNTFKPVCARHAVRVFIIVSSVVHETYFRARPVKKKIPFLIARRNTYKAASTLDAGFRSNASIQTATVSRAFGRSFFLLFVRLVHYVFFRSLGRSECSSHTTSVGLVSANATDALFSVLIIRGRPFYSLLVRTPRTTRTRTVFGPSRKIAPHF